MNATAPVPQVAAPVPPACDRCGSFHADAPVPLRGKRLCAACGERVLQEIRSTRLWPVGYLWIVGVLLNGATAAVLAALNWRRLGENKRSGSTWVLSAIGLVGTTVMLAHPNAPLRYSILWNVLVTRLAVTGLDVPWRTHKEQGGMVANRILPVVITVSIAVAAIAGFIAIELALGYLVWDE